MYCPLLLDQRSGLDGWFGWVLSERYLKTCARDFSNSANRRKQHHEFECCVWEVWWTEVLVAMCARSRQIGQEPESALSQMIETNWKRLWTKKSSFCETMMHWEGWFFMHLFDNFITQERNFQRTGSNQGPTFFCCSTKLPRLDLDLVSAKIGSKWKVYSIP